MLAAVAVQMRADAADSPPHVSECNFCSKCHLVSVVERLAERSVLADSAGRRALQGLVALDESEDVDVVGLSSSEERELRAEAAPGDSTSSRAALMEELWRERTAAASLPAPKVVPPKSKSDLWRRYMPAVDAQQGGTGANCSACSGCRHRLAELRPQQTYFGQPFRREPGRSAATALRVTSANAQQGVALAKFWCLPFANAEGKFDPSLCESSNSNKTRLSMDDQEAVFRVAQECGMEGIVPRQWVENITAVMPETGYVVRQPALLQDYVDGISLQALSRHKDKAFVMRTLQRIKPKQVVLAALYDTLFAQADRHPQNVLLDARANLYLIDNDKALSGAPNSIFLPQTLHHVFTYYGRPYVSSRGVEPLTRPSPLAQLDYRCHTENESRQIGREYPSRFKQCLRNLHFMDVEGIMSAYGFQSRSRAALLKERAGKLFAVRFEEAMAEMAPQSPTCRSYPLQAPCCRWKAGPGESAQCADRSWQPAEWADKIPCLKQAQPRASPPRRAPPPARAASSARSGASTRVAAIAGGPKPPPGKRDEMPWYKLRNSLARGGAGATRIVLPKRLAAAAASASREDPKMRLVMKNSKGRSSVAKSAKKKDAAAVRRTTAR
eukprot:jgi/Tetstr1/453844/TSEL_004006.t2